MSGGNFSLRLPEDIKELAAAQAAQAGISLNQYISMALAARVGAQAEAERYFSTRASRVTPGRAKQILQKAGAVAVPREDDRLGLADDNA